MSICRKCEPGLNDYELLKGLNMKLLDVRMALAGSQNVKVLLKVVPVRC